MKTNGTGKALLVLLNGKTPIDIPLKAQEKILTPIINLKNWIRRRQRTGGIGQMVPGGKIKYFAYPKQTSTRELEITYDADGKITGGMFGAADANGMIGGIKSTYGSTLLSDEITLKPARFLKHVFSNFDAKQEGLAPLVANKLADFTNEVSETALVDLKQAHVASFGAVGKWATDAGYVAPTTGTGKRLQTKVYPNTAQGGLDAKQDIIDILNYRDTIGLKDGKEPSYPLARGLNSSISCIITISSSINASLLKAVEESGNGFITGLGINKEKGLINSISYDGKTVSVEVVNDMPNKGSGEFNFSVEEIGRYGALALPNMWNPNALVRPDTASLASEFKVLEAVGLLAGLKYLQPELNFASFTQ